MAQYEGAERRRYPRIDTRLLLSYHVLPELAHKGVSETANISAGGVLITTKEKLASGTGLCLELYVPPCEEIFMVIGRVVSSQDAKDAGYHTRIAFLASDEMQKETIAFIKRQLHKD